MMDDLKEDAITKFFSILETVVSDIKDKGIWL